MQPFRYFLSATLLLFAACLAQAQNVGPDSRPSLPDMLAQQRQIRDQLQAGAAEYNHVDSMRRSRIYAAQGKVFALLEGHQSLSELATDDQLAVFNALKLIESHLVKRDEDDRMVCERVALVGTRRYETVCMTEADRRQRADKAKAMLLERAACTTSRCIGG